MDDTQNPKPEEQSPNLLDRTLAVLRGCLPTMDDALQDAVGKAEADARWKPVVEAYTGQVAGLRALMEELERRDNQFALADKAVAYVLERIRYDADVRYHMGCGTEEYKCLAAARMAATGSTKAEVETFYLEREMDAEPAAPALLDIRLAWQDYLIYKRRGNPERGLEGLLKELREVLDGGETEGGQR